MDNRSKISSSISTLLRNKWFYICLAAIVFRVVFSYVMGVWCYPNAMHDDALLIKYSNLIAHFNEPTDLSLVKYMAYPVFLKAVSVSNIPYSICLALVWVIAALSALLFAKNVLPKKAFYLSVFFYCLFMPVAFESYFGTRIYRNSIIAPFVVITFCLVGLLIFSLKKEKINYRRSVIIAIFAGLFFAFTYYIKEDGIWILACLLFAMLIMAVICIKKIIRHRKRILKNIISMAVVILIPIFIFECVTFAYKSINYYYFGVFETQTRTEGELGEFVEYVYKIYSPNRTSNLWTPIDAIEKAFEASDTLGSYPELYEAIRYTPWFDGDAVANPIHGDFLTWVLRTALVDTGIWENEKQVSELFAQINSELDEAFENGTLIEDTERIQLLSSAGGKTLEEIWDLKDIIVVGFEGAILLYGYIPGAYTMTQEIIDTEINVSILTADTTHEDYLYTAEDRSSEIESTGAIVSVIFWVYRIVNAALFAFSVFVIIHWIICLLRNLRHPVRWASQSGGHSAYGFMTFVFSGISFVYSFGIAWFSSFLCVNGIDRQVINFYNIALPVLLMFMYMFAVKAFSCVLSKRKA